MSKTRASVGGGYGPELSPLSDPQVGGSATVLAVPRLALSEIVTNLVDNAIRYTQPVAGTRRESKPRLTR